MNKKVGRFLWHSGDVIKRIALFVVGILRAIIDDLLILFGYFVTYNAIDILSPLAAKFFLGLTAIALGFALSRRK